MAENSTIQPRRPTPRLRRNVIMTVLVLMSLVLLGAVLWVAVPIGGAPFTLRDLLSHSSNLDPAEDTETLCSEVECIEGWRTNAGVFLRFGTTDAAEYWHYVVGGDSIRNGNILLDLNGLELTQDDRRLAIDILFSGRDWNLNPATKSELTFPDGSGA